MKREVFLRRRPGRAAIAVAAALTAIAGLAGCAEPAASDEESSIRIAVSGIGAQYDPGLAVIYNALNLCGVYDTLLVSNAEGGFDPWLATEWQLSEDRRTASFTLRDDVDFVDGVHLDAEAVVTLFEMLVARDDYWALAVVNEYDLAFEATGEYTFEVSASKPIIFDVFGTLTLVQPIASPEAAADLEVISAKPVGSGPYLIDEVEPEVSMKLVRNPDYWNPEAYPFDTVELRVIEDDVAALNALTSGQIDATALSIPNGLEAEARGFTISASKYGSYMLWFADRGGEILPAIADLRVRQAINYAFDRELINETLNHGFGVVSSQAFSPKQPEYVEGGDDYYTYDLDRARELMAEAGYADGFDLTIPATGLLGTTAIAPLVQQTLSEIGIRVTFEEIPEFTAYLDRVGDGTLPVTLENGAYVTAFMNYGAANGVSNTLGYVDPHAEDLVALIRGGTLEESAEASRELGRYMLEQAWLAPFSAPLKLYATAPGYAVELEAGNSGAPYLVNFDEAD